MTTTKLEPLEIEHAFQYSEDADDRTTTLLTELASENHNILIKTVRNEEWKTLFERLEKMTAEDTAKESSGQDKHGNSGTTEENTAAFSSSFSLPPKKGAGMNFFGTLQRSSCGLMLDASKVGRIPTRKSLLEVKSCRNFKTGQGCKQGDKCPFRHEPVEDKQRTRGMEKEDHKSSTSPLDMTAQLNELWCWPPGVFAKTEFNLDAGGQPTSQVVEKAACRFEELRDFNLSRSLMENGERISLLEPEIEVTESPNDAGDNSIGEGRTRDSQTAFMDGNGPISHYMRFLPYNEVFCPVEAGAIVGLFSRTKQRKHLLFLMSLQHRLSQVIGRYRRDSHGKHSRVKDLQTTIPLLVLTPEVGAQPFTERDRALLVHDYVTRSEPIGRSTFLSAYAIDLSRMKLPPLTVSLFHGKYGTVDGTIRRTLATEYRKSGFSSLESLIYHGLAASVATNNTKAALSLVKYAAPYVLRHKTNDVKMRKPSPKRICNWSAGMCEDGSMASVYCIECCEYLCETCHTRHSCGRATRHHSVENITKPRPCVCTWKAGVCEDGTAASFFCNDCSQFLCSSCYVVHARGRSTRSHSAHSVMKTFVADPRCTDDNCAASTDNSAIDAQERTSTKNMPAHQDALHHLPRSHYLKDRNAPFTTISAIASAAASSDDENQLGLEFSSDLSRPSSSLLLTTDTPAALHPLMALSPLYQETDKEKRLQTLLTLEIKSDEMLAIVGALHTVIFVASGKTPKRIETACNLLSEWIAKADSIAFRVSSWWQESEKRKRGDGEIQLQAGEIPESNMKES